MSLMHGYNHEADSNIKTLITNLSLQKTCKGRRWKYQKLSNIKALCPS